MAESQAHLQEAAQQYRAALKQNPKYTDAMFRLGIVYTQLESYPKAIEIWNQYVKATNGSATAYSNLGFCEEVAGDPNAAEAAYRKGIAKDPLNVLPPAKAHYDLAAVYESLRRLEEARREYGKALACDPRLDDAKSKLAALPNN